MSCTKKNLAALNKKDKSNIITWNKWQTKRYALNRVKNAWFKHLKENSNQNLQTNSKFMIWWILEDALPACLLQKSKIIYLWVTSNKLDNRN